jgi:hypothetical protein
MRTLQRQLLIKGCRQQSNTWCQNNIEPLAHEFKLVSWWPHGNCNATISTSKPSIWQPCMMTNMATHECLGKEVVHHPSFNDVYTRLRFLRNQESQIISLNPCCLGGPQIPSHDNFQIPISYPLWNNFLILVEHEAQQYIIVGKLWSTEPTAQMWT